MSVSSDFSATQGLSGLGDVHSDSDVLPERPEESAPIESGFEMVIPAPKAQRGNPVNASAQVAPPPSGTLSNGLNADSVDLFAHRPVQAVQPQQSALSVMLADAAGSSSSNPFAELYSAISGRSESESMDVNVYFPHAREPAGRPLRLQVRKDATVEEVLGFALWSYWEEGRLPKLDEGLDGDEDPRWETRCSAVGWILRIAEDDGEVDEDFPRTSVTGES